MLQKKPETICEKILMSTMWKKVFPALKSRVSEQSMEELDNLAISLNHNLIRPIGDRLEDNLLRTKR